MIIYLLWRLATLLLNRLPLRVSYACAALLANGAFLFWGEKRRNTIENMLHVLPEADDSTARRVARDSWRNYGKYLVDFLRAAGGRTEGLTSSIEFEGRSLVDQAFGEGKGVLLVLMHHGSWDIGGAFFSQLGYPLNVVTETFEHGKLNSLVLAARRTSGMRVIPMERSGLRLLRALRRNEALAILIDRPYPDNGVAVQFFGGETVLPSGPARLALRTGARVIAAAVVRTEGPGNCLKALVDVDITAPRTGNDAADVRALTEAFLRAHERLIRCYPDQWYMFRRMWRTEPEAQATMAPV
ncbi:MAG TPA: lysophospholipid acyltransferase family protein [Dehalococcoidia bacterium]|nr:lysophospholipid acyltransferase family protein [Dehalococcoidia bacterium]